MLSAAFATRPARLPRGWFFVVASEGLPAGSAVVARVASRDLLVFRGVSGQVHATWNVCPHLGARLGDGGRVVGDTFECPLHRRRYRMSTGAPDEETSGVLMGLPVREQNGLVLTWVAPDGAAPDFEVPPVDEDRWTAPVFETLEVPTSAEVVMQDLADATHFTTVHGYRGVAPFEPFAAEGASIGVAYAIIRRLGTGLVGYDQSLRFRSRAHGLGYQVTEVASFGGAMRSRHFVLPTPIDGERTRLTIALSVRLGNDDAPVAPGRGPHPVATLLATPVMHLFKHDIRLDARAWVARYPIGDLVEPQEPDLRAFQRWATQFYPPSPSP